MSNDPLTAEERDVLTIWGDTISAQIRSDDEPIVLYVRDDAPRSPEDGNPVILTASDAAKLRELLNEAKRREEA